jgi:arsenite methyltransferase
MNTSPDTIRETVREGYAAIAEAETSCCTGGSCCGSSPEVARELAVKLGYDPAILETLPEGTNLGLSCGNPQAIAELQPGEVVLDLGSGAGFDVFLAARSVGPEGFAIGVDMTSQMLAKARRNAKAFTERTGLDNVEFRLGEIEHLPVADMSVDVVISNCVLNLSPDKEQVWDEIGRVLVPGGRVAISDLALRQPLPTGVFELAESLVGCVAGAVLVEEIHAAAEAAGLVEIAIEIKPQYVAAMENMQDPLYRQILELLPVGHKLSDYIVSVSVSAHVPCEGCDGNCDCGGHEEGTDVAEAEARNASGSCCGEFGDVASGKACC